jgi:hypothetical protein
MLDLCRRNPSFAVSLSPRIGKGDFFGFLVVTINNADVSAIQNMVSRPFEDTLGLFPYRFIQSFGSTDFLSLVRLFALRLKVSVECNPNNMGTPESIKRLISRKLG